nr:MAG TPA: hypothetical protein [Caudoviricetes sp.]
MGGRDGRQGRDLHGGDAGGGVSPQALKNKKPGASQEAPGRVLRSAPQGCGAERNGRKVDGN